MQTDFEAMGGSYYKEGDYLLPNLETPENPKIGVWGQRHRKYLQTSQRALYTAMLLGDTLNSHLAEVDKSASEMFDRLVEQLKDRDCITEDLKEANQLEWVRRMNVIRHEAADAVTREWICV